MTDGNKVGTNSFLEQTFRGSRTPGRLSHTSTVSDQVQAWQPHAEFVRVLLLVATDDLRSSRALMENNGGGRKKTTERRGEVKPSFRSQRAG